MIQTDNYPFRLINPPRLRECGTLMLCIILAVFVVAWNINAVHNIGVVCSGGVVCSVHFQRLDCKQFPGSALG